jgi:hypothetical protein
MDQLVCGVCKKVLDEELDDFFICRACGGVCCGKCPPTCCATLLSAMVGYTLEGLEESKQ